MQIQTKVPAPLSGHQVLLLAPILPLLAVFKVSKSPGIGFYSQNVRIRAVLCSKPRLGPRVLVSRRGKIRSQIRILVRNPAEHHRTLFVDHLSGKQPHQDHYRPVVAILML